MQDMDGCCAVLQALETVGAGGGSDYGAARTALPILATVGGWTAYHRRTGRRQGSGQQGPRLHYGGLASASKAVHHALRVWGAPFLQHVPVCPRAA